VRVIATTVDGTRAALATAVPLACGSSARLVIMLSRIGTSDSRLGGAIEKAEFLTRRYRDFAVALGGDADVELCPSRRIGELLDRIDRDDVAVVGGPGGGWFMSPEERFARRLSRHAKRVIFVTSGPATARVPIRLLAVVAATALSVATPARAHAGQVQSSREDLLRRIEVLEAEVATLKREVEAQNLPVAADAAPALPHDAADDQETNSVDSLNNLKFGVALDTYYEFNFNRPIGRVNLLRAYDVTSNNFSLNQAAVILESAPDLDAGRRFGGRVDLQYGQATETLQGSLANEPRPWVYRNVFQAYGTYVAPIGSGLTIDFGKWASALGIEGNYTKDQINYSRSYLFDFLPFYHMGARVNYRFTPAVAVNYWITNGTQQTESFNNFKDQFFGTVLQPTKSITWNIQYYLGQEHPDVQVASTQSPGTTTLPTQPGLSIVPVVPYFTGKLHILDTYATWQATPKTTVAFEADHVVSRNRAPAADYRVSGAVGYLKRQLTGKTAFGARVEFLSDDAGLFSGRAQKLTSAALTYDYAVADGFLVCTEWRRDASNIPFFLTHDLGALEKSQQTATLGLIWWWGTKRGAW
jgi:Putative beta-barrel porin-2, OmpL-like. bbp2